ncbi:hypothetical protein NE237_027345 [Protea cynaroides]|uniref:Tudor domain-containing protein n=1 Tax=Protea cynaroides TaxID=273540 RepID=A0A9Q0GPY7_9MAGN|nr:hypothetical protein NE237_027345 [Protea cynaroides]
MLYQTCTTRGFKIWMARDPSLPFLHRHRNSKMGNSKMAFWGVELKPGKPYIHRYDDALGRLHVCRATLGLGKPTKKILVQCNVGKKSAIVLCSLIPDKTESCSLGLEFEEDDDVVFSVLGTHSVHLTGFYLKNGGDFGGCDHQDDFDSCRENIAAETKAKDSTDYGTGGFHDDHCVHSTDHEAFPPSPVPNSGVANKEILDDDKLPKENGNNKHSSEKGQQSNFDYSGSSQCQIVAGVGAGASVLEREDDDSVPTIQNSEAKLKEKKDKEIAKEGKNKRKHVSDQVSGLRRKFDTVQVGDPEGSRWEESCKKVADSSLESVAKSLNKYKSSIQGTPKIYSKRKHIPGNEDITEMQHGAIDYGENLVGSKIKIYWPKDQMFYEGVITSFDPVKMKHKVSYHDGDVEILNLSRERWQFIKEDDGAGDKKVAASSLKSVTKSSDKDKSKVKGTPKIHSKRKQTPGNEDTYETQHGAIVYGENLVGSKIKVYWPNDHMFYECVIESFDPVKMEHKVNYNDGDVEILNLNRERWQFIKGDDGAGDKVAASSLKSVTKSSHKDKSQVKGTPKIHSKRKRTPGNEDTSEPQHGAIGYGSNLVGSRIKVYWPNDHMFYDCVVIAFDPVKMKHKVHYDDGDVEKLNLRRQRWQFSKKKKGAGGQEADFASPDASSDMHRKKKAKTNLDSSTKQRKTDASAKRAGGVLTSKSKSKVPESGGKVSKSRPKRIMQMQRQHQSKTQESNMNGKEVAMGTHDGKRTSLGKRKATNWETGT